MTRRLTNTMLIAGLSVLLGSFAVSAQSSREVADIPFDFHAQGVTLPAGTYTVKQVNENGLFQIYDGTGHSTFLSAPIKEMGATGNPRLLFRCTGNERILAQVWTVGDAGYSVPDSWLEKQNHRRLDMAALVSVRLTSR